MNSNAHLSLRTNGAAALSDQDFLRRHKEFPTLGCFLKSLSERGREQEGPLCQHWLPVPTRTQTTPRWAQGLGAHRSVWLNEAVLQFPGHLPIAL